MSLWMGRSGQEPSFGTLVRSSMVGQMSLSGWLSGSLVKCDEFSEKLWPSVEEY